MRETKIRYEERERVLSHKRKREKIHCVRVSVRFTEFSFGLNVSLHPDSELDVLIVDLERFRITHATVKSVSENNTV